MKLCDHFRVGPCFCTQVVESHEVLCKRCFQGYCGIAP